jgi:membrane associated rhomboid family serine protease
MWYLWIFGDNIEDCLGKTRFIYFYLLWASSPTPPRSSSTRLACSHRRASGAISGLLGAYLMLFPRARIATLIPIFPIFPIIQIPAVLFLPLWFFIQLQHGAAALFTAGTNIAWWAHIGGFVAGFVMARFIQPRKYK